MSTAGDIEAENIYAHDSDDEDAGKTDTKDSDHNEAGVTDDDKRNDEMGVIMENDYNKSDYLINLEKNVLLMEFPKDIIYGYVVLNIFGIWKDDLSKEQKRFYWCLMILTVLLQIIVVFGLAFTADFASNSINDANFDAAFFKFGSEIENIHMSVVSIDTLMYDNYTNNSMAKNDTTWLNSTQNINDTTTDTYLGDYTITLEFGSRFEGEISYKIDSTFGTLFVKIVSLLLVAIYCVRDGLSHLPFNEFCRLTKREDLKAIDASLAQLHRLGNNAAVMQFCITYFVAMPASFMIVGASDAFTAITNCVAAVFILEVDNWMYDILSNRMTRLNDKLFTVKFKIPQKLQKKLKKEYENSRMKANLKYICYLSLPVSLSLVLLLVITIL